MQQELNFGLFATPVCNHMKPHNPPRRPDVDGLFDADGVADICARRQCWFEAKSELFCTVRCRDKTAALTARDVGRWHPVDILAACTTAHGWPIYGVEGGRIRNAGGVDEVRVAAVVGADSCRPYLSRKTWSDKIGAYLQAGDPTHALHSVLYDQTATGDYAVRRALRALEDAGLLAIEMGPRGGMAKAKCTWTPLAYLAPGRLAQADDEALGELA